MRLLVLFFVALGLATAAPVQGTPHFSIPTIIRSHPSKGETRKYLTFERGTSGRVHQARPNYLLSDSYQKAIKQRKSRPQEGPVPESARANYPDIDKLPTSGHWWHTDDLRGDFLFSRQVSMLYYEPRPLIPGPHLSWDLETKKTYFFDKSSQKFIEIEGAEWNPPMLSDMGIKE